MSFDLNFLDRVFFLFLLLFLMLLMMLDCLVLMMLLSSFFFMLVVQVKLDSLDLAGTQQGHRCDKSDDGSSHY